MAENLFFKDLQLNWRRFNRMASDRDYVDLSVAPGGDLQTVSGRANLAQAIINRLLTRKGELSRLGHPNYGSRLYQLTGELNNNRIRGLAEIYIRESLAQERRIEEVSWIEFQPPSRGIDRNLLLIRIGVKPVGNTEAFAIELPLNL